jgi:hypothetical protein
MTQMTALDSVNDSRKFVYYTEIITSSIPVSYTDIIKTVTRLKQRTLTDRVRRNIWVSVRGQRKLRSAHAHYVQPSPTRSWSLQQGR